MSSLTHRHVSGPAVVLSAHPGGVRMEFTRVATLKDLARENWTVWSVTTKSGSTYSVGLRQEDGKRLGILRGRNKEDGTHLEIHDREPRLDSGKLLYDVQPSKWV